MDLFHVWFKREILYPAHVLISFWCDSDIKNIDFSKLILEDISVMFILAIIKIW